MYEFRIFGGPDNLSDKLEGRLTELKTKIKSENPEYILDIDENKYIQSLINKYHIEPLNLKFEDKYLDSEEREIPAEYFPANFFVYRGKTYPKPVLIFCIPYEGDHKLLEYRPNPVTLYFPTVYRNNNAICLEYIQFETTEEYNNKIKSNFTSDWNVIFKNLNYLNNQIISFNKSLENTAKSFFENRKKEIIESRNSLNSFDMPIKTKKNSNDTYSVPVEKHIQKPEINIKTHEKTLEPTLSDEDYSNILKTIHNIGNTFEKYPNNYYGKNEEGLRDFIVSHLETNYPSISITGESYNKSGKSDILIKYQSKNLFVAECKFWGGGSEYTPAISQLLNNLTWRDSKSALIIFVKNMKIGPVLEEIKKCTKNHPDFLEDLGDHDQSWQNYIFKLNGDDETKIKLAVLIFHVPPVNNKRVK
uniref:Uncharacterized protein n=1 Tax=Methanococcus maripaludis (strain C6 / ATCC BAA-1332) TaxID=444158 RepID=A9A6E9_METM6